MRGTLPRSYHSSPLSSRVETPSLYRDLRRSRQNSAIKTGFWRAVLLITPGTARFSFEAPHWVSTSFDPTLGFPGEGPNPPPHRPWRLNSAPAVSHSASLPLPGSKWRQWALGTLQGVIPLHPDHYLTERSAADDVHFCLLALAEAGNSPSPIAARIQSRPHRLESLLGKNTVTAIQATGGSAYNVVTRPFQYGRPRTIHLDKSQQDAVATEIARL
jgi:hypothetical protein